MKRGSKCCWKSILFVVLAVPVLFLGACGPNGLSNQEEVGPGEEGTFPATIKIEFPTRTIDESFVNDYPVDLVRGNTAYLYVTETEYRQLATEFSDQIAAGEVKIEIYQTHEESMRNFYDTSGSYLTYPTYDGMVQELKQMESQGKGTLRSIGTSENGRTIYAFGKGGGGKALFTGCIHGNEKVGAVVAMYLLNNSSKNFWVIPILNVDGYPNSRTNANGTDMNRDFTNMSSKGIKAYTSFIKQNGIEGILDAHTFGGFYLYPHCDKSSTHSKSQQVSSKMGSASGLGSYNCGQQMGTTYGSSLDWEINAGVDMAVGVEYTNSHSPPTSQLDSIASGAFKGFEVLVNEAGGGPNPTPTPTPGPNPTPTPTPGPNPTPTPPPNQDSCQGMCGKKSGSCWCDNLCKQYGDCCADYDQFCGDNPNPTPNPTPQPTPNPTPQPTPDPNPGPNSCMGKCGSQAAGGCWCDSWCEYYGDCCADKKQVCGY